MTVHRTVDIIVKIAGLCFLIWVELVAIHAGALEVALVTARDPAVVSILFGEMTSRGHSVRVIVGGAWAEECVRLFSGGHCVVLNGFISGPRGNEGSPLFVEYVEAKNGFLNDFLSDELQSRGLIPDVFVADALLPSVDAVAMKMERPVVFLWSSVATAALGVNCGANPVTVRTATDANTHIQSYREKYQRAVVELLENRHFLIPYTSWDNYVGSLCPNRHYTVFFGAESVHPIPRDLDDWMSECSGVIYVDYPGNFSSSSGKKTVSKSLKAISVDLDMCVVWRGDVDRVHWHEEFPHKMLRVVNKETRDREGILRHKKTKIYVGRCEEQMVHTSILSEVLFFGIAESSYELDLCRGAYLPSMVLLDDSEDPHDFPRKVRSAVLQEEHQEMRRRIKRFGYLVSNGHSASKIVEHVSALGHMNTDFMCARQSYLKEHNIDVIVFASGMCAFILLVCRKLASYCL